MWGRRGRGREPDSALKARDRKCAKSPKPFGSELKHFHFQTSVAGNKIEVFPDEAGRLFWRFAVTLCLSVTIRVAGPGTCICGQVTPLTADGAKPAGAASQLHLGHQQAEIPGIVGPVVELGGVKIDMLRKPTCRL